MFSLFEFEVWGDQVHTGITDIWPGHSISVFPNPATSGDINIAFKGSWVQEYALLSVTDISGQVVLSRQINIAGGNDAILLIHADGRLQPGLYILNITGKKTANYARLLIK